MAKILILEDCPNRMRIFRETLGERHEIVHFDTARDCIAYLGTNVADVIFLDHDLGGSIYVDAKDANTGSEVVRFMKSTECSWAGPIIVHSMNTPEAENMERDLRMAGYSHVYRIPFSSLARNYLHDPGFIV